MVGRGEPDEAKIVQFKEELIEKLNAYERILAKQPYMAGQVHQPTSPHTYMVSTLVDVHLGRFVSPALRRIAIHDGRRCLDRVETQCDDVVGSHLIKACLESGASDAVN